MSKQAYNLTIQGSIMSNQAYSLTIGETGNEQGHAVTIDAPSDAAAMTTARQACACYGGDGWWMLTQDGCTVANGGRQ